MDWLKTLDLGCGKNKVMDNVVGVDLKKTADVAADAQFLPFCDEAFTRVFSKRSIQHIKDDERVFKEIHRVLAPAGCFVLVVPSWIGWLFFMLYWRWRYRDRYSFFKLYSKRTIKQKLKKCGFTVYRMDKHKGRFFAFDYCTLAGKRKVQK